MITPQSIGLTILIPILARCHPDLLLEQAREVLWILEAELVGHLIDGQFLVHHILFREVDDLVLDVALRRETRLFLDEVTRAMPPHPQMPMTPIFSASTFSCFDRKSTAAMKSSVLMSGDAVRRGSPLLSPVKDDSGGQPIPKNSEIGQKCPFKEIGKRGNTYF